MTDFDFDYFAENDPEAFNDQEDEVRVNDSFEDEIAAAELDPFADWFMPGYVTEMDYMNALEADDYRDEFSDMEGDIDF
jgi:hypothetical protein